MTRSAPIPKLFCPSSFFISAEIEQRIGIAERSHLSQMGNGTVDVRVDAVTALQTAAKAIYAIRIV
jgi:hypothetical protein